MSRGGLLAGTLIVIVLGVGAWLWPGGDGKAAGEQEVATDGDDAGQFRPPAAGQTPVTVAAARRGQLVKRITATGVAEAERLVRVTAQTGGRIAEVAVREGELVEEGQLLVALDETELRLARDQAEAQLNSAVMQFANNRLVLPDVAAAGETTLGSDQNALEFLRELISADAYRALLMQRGLEDRLRQLTRDDLASAQSGLAQQIVTLEQRELELQRARVLAPFSGQVTGIQAQSGPNALSWPVVGQQVGGGTELMLLVDADPIRLRVEVIESEMARVREGRRAEVVFPAYPDEVFHGVVEAISPLVFEKSLAVTVRLPNPDRRIKPGMFAEVVLDTEIYEDRLLVPASAVLWRNEPARPLVFIVRNLSFEPGQVIGRAMWEYIEIGLENEQFVEVVRAPGADGELGTTDDVGRVEEGDIVLTGGHFTMAHDSAVQISNAADVEALAEQTAAASRTASGGPGAGPASGSGG